MALEKQRGVDMKYIHPQVIVVVITDDDGSDHSDSGSDDCLLAT